MNKRTASKNSVIHTSIMEDYDFITKLIVGIGEVAKITGIPQRQLRYWQAKGIIDAKTENNTSSTTRRFDYCQIKKILLIKELLDEGFTLEAAAQKVAKRIETLSATFKKFQNKKIK